MGNKTILLTHTDLDGYGSNLLLETYDIRARMVNLDNHIVDSYVLEMIRRLKEKEMDIPKALFITDLGLKPEVAKELNEWYQRLPEDKKPTLKLFDHHKTALHLNQYDWATVIVGEGMNKPSGTSLFYEFLKSETDRKLPEEKQEKLNRLVELIRSYDTWEWKETNDHLASDLNDLFYLMKRNLFIQHRLDWLNGPYSVKSCFFEQERFLLSMERERIKNYLRAKSKQMVVLNDFFKNESGKYFNVGVLQAENYISELGDHLCQTNRDLDFVAMFDVTKNKVSFRARKPEVDLTPLVKSFGGGGHSQAAGCSLNGIGFELIEKVYDKMVTK